MIFGDEDDYLSGFTYSPFQIRIDDEDEASIMKDKLKSLHATIDQLLLASKASSSKAYSIVAVESILEQVTKEHAANAMTMSKIVSDSADVCKTTTKKLDKLTTETIEFMNGYKTTYNSSTASANQAIHNFGALFKTENANFV